IIGHRVLVTGASGGVGHLAVELANQGGAIVVASVRRSEREKHARAAGAHEVVVGEDPAAAAKFGPYDLILESLGGHSLGAAMKMIAPGGMCVLYGVSASSETTFDAATFMRTGGGSLYGFILFHEIPHRPAAQGLARLVEMVAGGRLHPQIELEAPFEQIAAVAAKRKCCNFENGDGGGPERNWAARSQAARSNSWSMNRFCWRTASLLTHRACPLRI